MLFALNRKGFTLVEVLIVISIIGIFSAVVYINYSDARDQAIESKVRAELQNVQVALELYKSQYGRYPEPQDNGNFWCPSVDVNFYGTDITFSVTGSGYYEEDHCLREPVVQNLIPDFIAELPGEKVNYPCRMVYMVDNQGSAYKFAAHDCDLGFSSQSEGVQPDDELAKCPSTCSTCGLSMPGPHPDYDHTVERFYTSFAVYSEGGECY